MGAIFPQCIHQPAADSFHVETAETIRLAGLVGARLPVEQPPVARPQRDLAQRFAEVGNNDSPFAQFILQYD